MLRTRQRSARFACLAALLASALLLGACASGGGSESAAGETQAAKTAPPKGVAPPAGHPLGQVEMRMRPDQVRKAMGEPDSVKRYITGKAFNPFYFGADSGRRTEYSYAGKGRVVFSINRWSGQETVVRVDYDPDEDGQ